MSSDHIDKSMKRRKILKAAGVAGAAGLAGCTGGDGGDGGDGGGGDGGDGGGGDGGDGDGGDGGDGGGGDGGDGDGGDGGGGGMDSVTFEFWNTINIQTRVARDTSEAMVQEFQDSSGHTVEQNFSSYTDLAGAKWLNRFKAGNYPVLYDAESFLSGGLVDGGWPSPIGEWVDQFENQDLVDQTEWVWSDMLDKQAYRGFEGEGIDNVWEFPYIMDIRQPNIRRTDHFEQAGLSTELGDIHGGRDGLAENSVTLKQEGPGEWTLPVFGVAHDWMDVSLGIWTVIQGQADGLMLNDDWSGAQFTNDTWTDVYKDYTGYFLDPPQGVPVSPPNTPTLPDEDVVPEVIAGAWSQGWADPWNHGGFIRQAGDMLDNGTITYNAHWEGPGGNGMPFGSQNLGLTKVPEGGDSNRWSRKQSAAIQFVEKLASVSFQERTIKGFGGPGANEAAYDAYDEVAEDQAHGLNKYFSDTLQHPDTRFMTGSHPQMSRIYSTMNAPFSQDVLRGKLSPEDGLQAIKEETESNLGRWAE